MKVELRRRRNRKGIGTVLATIIFVFIVVFMTANLIVWGIVQSANLQGVINQMTQRDQTQASEKLALGGAVFGNTNKYTNTVAPFSSTSGTAKTIPIANMNFSTDISGWTFTKVLAPGTSSGISGGFDAGGTENGAIGSPSGPGLIYMGVSFFPPAGTALYSATWSTRFLIDLSKFGVPTGQSLASASTCSGPNCPIGESWAWILPRVNPGVIAMTVKAEIANPTATGTSCSPPNCYTIDSQGYTTLADQTWNYRKVTFGGVSLTGSATGSGSTTLQDTAQAWTTDQWKNYLVQITSGAGAGQSRLITGNTASGGSPSDQLTVNTAWSVNPAAGSSYTIALSDSGTASAGSTSTTLQDTSKSWYTNEWAGYSVSITANTGAGQSRTVLSNTATTLTLSSTWATSPDNTSGYVIGCASATFCGYDISSGNLLNTTPTTYTPAFWGVAGSPTFYTMQVEADFVLSQSANPAEVRILFDDIGLAFGWPANFASPPGSAVSGAAIIDLPLTGGESPSLITRLGISTATAYNTANVQQQTFLKDYATGVYDTLSTGLVSQQTVNTTSVFLGADVQKYIGSVTSQNYLNQPSSVAFDSSGNLWVADQLNNRIVEFTAASLAGNGPNAAIVIGQSSFTTSASATSASGLNGPTSIAFDSGGNLWVADQGNNRVLKFPTAFSNGESATIVIGQSTFTSASPATSASGLSTPAGIAFDSGGNLWVADQGNNRVLKFPTAFSNGESATIVIGEADFTSSGPPPDSGTATGAGQSSTTLVDTSKAWNVNQWKNGIVSITAGTGVGQSRVITSNTANTLTVTIAWTTTPVAGSSQYSISPALTTQRNLGSPIRLSFDSNNLWVSDSGNNRIVEFTAASLAGNGPNAAIVIGQSSFTTSASATSASGLSGPAGIAFDSSHNLWVGDTGNNRVLEYTAASLAGNGPNAAIVIGQSSMTGNLGFTTQSGLNSPNGVVFDSSGNLWIADKVNYRVEEFTAASLAGNGPNAAIVIGQSSFTVGAHPNVELKITAQKSASFSVTTMKAAVQDFYSNPNYVSIQVANSWSSSSHVVDIFITDSSGTHCFTRVPSGCEAAYASSTLTGSSSTTLTDSVQAWTTNQWAGYFAYIVSGASAGEYSTIASNTATVLTLGSTLATVPATGSSYIIGQTWAGIYVAPGTTGVIALHYTWANGPVTFKVTTDLGNSVVLNTIAG